MHGCNLESFEYLSYRKKMAGILPLLRYRKVVNFKAKD
jgi:hypothetical protein